MIISLSSKQKAMRFRLASLCDYCHRSSMARYHDCPSRPTAEKFADHFLNRQKYSLYLPLTSRSHRKGSISKPDEKARKDRENAISRASVDSVPGKRRPTIRSRENYEEEEQFRQAIEESKRDNDTGTTGRRNGKRAREEGEE